MNRNVSFVSFLWRKKNICCTQNPKLFTFNGWFPKIIEFGGKTYLNCFWPLLSGPIYAACLSKGAQLHHIGAENHRYVDPAEVCRRRRHLSRNSCTTLRNVLLLVQRVQAFYILLEYATIIAPSGHQAFWNFVRTKSDYCNWSGIVLRYLWSSAGLPGESPFILVSYFNMLRLKASRLGYNTAIL